MYPLPCAPGDGPHFHSRGILKTSHRALEGIQTQPCCNSFGTTFAECSLRSEYGMVAANPMRVGGGFDESSLFELVDMIELLVFLDSSIESC